MDKSNAARKLEFDEVIKGIGNLEVTSPGLLADLILSPDDSVFKAIEYWEKKKHNASSPEVKAVALGQIDLLERNLMTKARLVGDILRSADVTKDIASELPKETTDIKQPEPIIKKEKETKVIDINSKKEVVDEVAKEIEAIVTEKAENDISTIRSKTLALLREDKEKEALDYIESFLKKNGAWINKKGNPGHAMKAKEFNGLWQDLKDQANTEKNPPFIPDNKEEAKSEVETKVNDAPGKIREIKNENSEKMIWEKFDESTNTWVRVNEISTKDTVVYLNEATGEWDLTEKPKAKLFKEEPKLSTQEEVLAVYKVLYPTDVTDEELLASLTKPDPNVTAEEANINKMYAAIRDLHEEGEVKAAEALTKLFFSNRAYSETQISKWVESAKAKTPINNHLKFLTEAITLKEVNSLKDLVKFGTEAVQKDKISMDTIKAWVRANVFGKKLVEYKGTEDVINDEPMFENFFESIFGWLWKTKGPDMSPEKISENVRITTEALTEAVKNADAEKVTFAGVVNGVSKQLKEKEIVYNMTDLFKKAVEISKTENPELLKKHQEKKNQKNDDIKPNENFENEGPKVENPTPDSPGKEETTDTKKPVVDAEGVHEEEVDPAVVDDFKDLQTFGDYLVATFLATNKKELILEKAIEFLITKNQIEDAKDWTKEQVEHFVNGLTAPVNEEELEKEAVATAQEVVENASTEDVVATKKESATQKVVTNPTLNSITMASNKKEYANRVREAHLMHTDAGDAPKDSIDKIYEATIVKDSGKYTRQLGRGKKEDVMTTITRILSNAGQPVE